jgi:hypothetical protein
MGYRRSNESEEDDLSHTESEENTEKKKENLSKEKTMKSRQSSKIIASLFALLTLLAVGEPTP